MTDSVSEISDIHIYFVDRETSITERKVSLIVNMAYML